MFAAVTIFDTLRVLRFRQTDIFRMSRFRGRRIQNDIQATSSIYAG